MDELENWNGRSWDAADYNALEEMEIETFLTAYLHDLERSVKNLSLQFTKVEYNAASATWRSVVSA